MVWVSPAYGDTQTQGVVVGGHQRIVQHGLSISGVWRYSDTGGGDGRASEDCPGWSKYLRCMEILRHRGW